MFLASILNGWYTLALVLYEYTITIHLEAQQIWKREVSTAMILFLSTRYITLLDRLLVVVLAFSPDTLKVVPRTSSVFGLSPQLLACRRAMS